MRKLILAMMISLGLISFGATTNTEAAVNSSTNDPSGIKIDGHFDDWKDKPITDIKSGNDDYNIKHESLLADQDNIYFYLDMSPEHGYGYATLQPAGYELTVGDKKFSLTVMNSFNLQVNQPRKVDLWIYEHDNIDYVNKQSTKAEVYLNRIPIKVDEGVGQGYTEEMEFKLPLSELGITGTTSQDITMTNRNLGNQTLHVTGGSTGPVLLAISGFAIALFAIIKMPKIEKLRKSIHE